MREILGVFEFFLGIFKKTKERKDRGPATEPPDPTRFLKGSLNRSLKGALKGRRTCLLRRTLQNPFKNACKNSSKTFQEGVEVDDASLQRQASRGLKLQDAQPPLTPRRGMDYRGRVPDASP